VWRTTGHAYLYIFTISFPHRDDCTIGCRYHHELATIPVETEENAKCQQVKQNQEKIYK